MKVYNIYVMTFIVVGVSVSVGVGVVAGCVQCTGQ